MKLKKLVSFFSHVKTASSASTQPANVIGTDEIRALKAKGNEFLDLGKLSEAIENYQAVVDLCLGDAGAYIALGFAQLEAADLDAAKTNFVSALAIDAESVDAHFFMGQLLVRQRLPRQALQSFKAALELKPDFDFAWCELARAHEVLADLNAALNFYEKALAISPTFADAAVGKARVLLGLERWQDALGTVTSADLPKEHNLLSVYQAIALQRLKRNAEALFVIDNALLKQPNCVEALQVKGTILSALGDYDLALTYYLRAIKIDPQFSAALSDAGAIYAKNRKFDQAVEMYKLAIQAQPDNADAANNWASTLLGMGKCSEAIQIADAGLAVDSNNADLHWTKAVSSLLLGDFEQGWIEHEWRWYAKGLGPRPVKPSYAKPMWTGEPLHDKTIWVLQEQGLGDSLQLLRYIPLLIERGARVLLSVQQPIRSLCIELGDGCTLLSGGQVVPPFDYYCPMFSLPLGFKTRVDNVPAKIPYLRPQPIAKDVWDETLGRSRLPRIGLVWSGNIEHKNDENRSMSLSTLLTGLANRYHFVCLQKDVRISDQEVLKRSEVFDPRKELNTFADTAALISCIDLVISVDTSVAHLTGALGIPLWLMLPYCPDWRWMMHRADTPWYPTARLFRQDENCNWNKVVANINLALEVEYPVALR